MSYTDYIKNIRQEYARHGIEITGGNSAVHDIEQLDYMNRVMALSGSDKKIDSLYTGNEVLYTEWYKNKIKAEYEERLKKSEDSLYEESPDISEKIGKSLAKDTGLSYFESLKEQANKKTNISQGVLGSVTDSPVEFENSIGLSNPVDEYDSEEEYDEYDSDDEDEYD